MTRGAELPGVTLRAKDGEQVLEGIAKPLRVVVGELVDDLEEGTKRLRVTIGQVGVLEDLAEEQWNTGILRHLGNGLSVEVQGLVPAQPRAHQLGPSVASEFASEELSRSAEFLTLRVHVVHELVDQGNSDLLDLRFRVGHLAHEDVTSCVDSTFGFGV